MVGQNDYYYGNYYGGQTITQLPPGYVIDQNGGIKNVGNNVQMISRIPARFCESPEKIMPNEVPSDGTVSLFVQNDYKAIYAKQANQRGTIDTVKYVPEMPTPSGDENVPVTIDERLNKMESLMDERFSKIEKMLNKRNYYKKPYQNQKVQNTSSESEE